MFVMTEMSYIFALLHLELKLRLKLLPNEAIRHKRSCISSKASISNCVFVSPLNCLYIIVFVCYFAVPKWSKFDLLALAVSHCW